MKSDLVDIEVVIHHQTEKAVLVSLDGESDGAVWLPLSQIEIEIEIEEEPRSIAIVTMSERLANEKGLI